MPAKTSKKKAPSAAQVAARRRFAEMARSRRKKNIEMGFVDATGFHPIRSSRDYDPDRTDDDTIQHVRRGSIPRRRNVAAGFVDEDGVFHPIRASYDYSASRAGERSRGRGYARKGAKKQTRRRNQLGPAIIGGLGSAIGGKLFESAEDTKPARSQAQTFKVVASPPPRTKNFSFTGLFGKKVSRKAAKPRSTPRRKPTRADYNKAIKAHFGAARKKALKEISPARFGRNPKGQHQRLYEDIVTSPAAQKRYGGRLKEVAARTVRKVAAAGVNPQKFREQNPFFFGFRKYKGSVSHSGKRGGGRMTVSAFTKKGLARKKRKASRKLKGLFNPAAAQAGVFEEFRGRSPERVSVAKGHGPNGAVINIDELGKLREMTIGDKDIEFGTSARLIAGKDKRLRIAGVRFKKTGKTHDCGEVDWIVYKADKPHHGEPRAKEYEHPFGEEGGRKPHLMIDPEGYPYLRGGDYGIESAGIID